MHDSLTEKIIGAAYTVHNVLGFGFLESIYEKALSIELNKAGINHRCQACIDVIYKDHPIGMFACDLFVADCLIVELKSVANLAVAHEVQLVNYLAATKTGLGLLINFGPNRVEVKRKYRTYQSCPGDK